MSIVQAKITKIEAQVNAGSKGEKISVSNNIKLSNVEAMNLETGGKKGVRVTFNFESKYTPSIGSIKLEGQIMYVSESEKIDSMLEKWNSEKKIETDLHMSLTKAALTKSHLKAIKIADELGLATPYNLTPEFKKAN